MPLAKRDRKYVDGGGFEFLNQKTSFEGPSRWSPAGASRLWVYNLHYFQYLEEMNAAEGTALILDWITCNRDPGGPGFEPYTLSLRIREWIEWLQRHPDIESSKKREIVKSIALQTQAMDQQLEYHLLGNHILENAITLCWSGLSLEGPLCAGWLGSGIRILRRELNRQVLDDGTHDERSPMYQALITESLLRLAGVAEVSGKPHADTVYTLAHDAGTRMLATLQHLVHPDGGYALVNDTAEGVAARYQALLERFDAPQPVTKKSIGSFTLSNAGYLGWKDEKGTYLLFDAGPIGPHHQPGHGHADTLSFELSIQNSRVFTDTGVFTYDVSQERDYDRSTLAHNTIEVDGRDQSELWQAFRCGRRTIIEHASMQQTGEGAVFAGAYRGPGNIRHRRSLTYKSGEIAFVDTLGATGSHTGLLRLHLAPGLKLEKNQNAWTVIGDCCVIAKVVSNGLDWQASVSKYHPEFGIELERPCLSARIEFRDKATINWSIVWQP